MIRNALGILWDKINGIEYGSKITTKLELIEKTTKNQIESIVSSIDSKIVLSFYDAYYNLKSSEKPSVLGDLGAFTDVIKDDSKLYIKRGNHGWMDKYWEEISKPELTNIIYKSRCFNNGEIKIESRVARKIWRKNKNGKTLVYLYHKTSK